jgi:diphthine synthase
MLYIIGLGLNEKGISKEGLLALEKCHKVYLDSYTVDFPYDLNELRLGKKIIPLKRKDIESNRLIKEAKGRRVVLLVYGSPLFATTHMSLVLDAKAQNIEVKVIYSTSVFDAVAETGLQLYKFGKIASMPDWNNNKAEFMEYVKENQSIKAHSLILIDIGLSFEDALNQLDVESKEKKIKIDKIVVCSRLGSNEAEVFYDSIDNLKEIGEEVKAPFCFIIPSELHFLEKDGLQRFKNPNS